MRTSPATSSVKATPSSATHYKRGRALEYRVQESLRSQGYLVIRSSGSHGPADLVALRPHPDARKKAPDVLLVQCKRNGRMSPGERSELAWIAERLNCRAAMVSSRLETILPTGGRRLVLDWFVVRADGTMAVMHGEGA